MAWRRKMRRSGFDPPVRLRTIDRFERIERPQQAFNVFRLAGMNQIQVKSIDRSALKHGGDPADHDELDLMRKEDSQNFQKISFRLGFQGYSVSTKHCAGAHRGARRAKGTAS